MPKKTTVKIYKADFSVYFSGALIFYSWKAGGALVKSVCQFSGRHSEGFLRGCACRF
jgi:hypothetical protein